MLNTHSLPPMLALTHDFQASLADRPNKNLHGVLNEWVIEFSE